MGTPAPYPLNYNTNTGHGTGLASSHSPATGYWNFSYPAPYPTAAPSILPGTGVPYPPKPTSSTYTFDKNSDHNVAVYYGTTPDTQIGGLTELCSNENVDIVILSFVYDFFAQNYYPSINFGPGCSGPSRAQVEKGASGLRDCTILGAEIVGCQQLGKKVLVSLGGYGANTSISSSFEVKHLAETMWNLFGGGTDDLSIPPFTPTYSDIRPFGPGVVVDGFDIDNENQDPSYYFDFFNALRSNFDRDSSKTYYISATPQCPMPDASIPYDLMVRADFVFIQFYNNPSCNLDSSGFQDSFAAWSVNLSGSGMYEGSPRIYIGAGAFDGAGSGYVEGSGLAVPISLARELQTENFGGVMLWDGSEALANVDRYGVDYLEYAKAALQG